MIAFGLALGALLLVTAMFSLRLQSSPVTMPMVFTSAGLILGAGALDVIDVSLGSGELELLATGALGLVLFAEAASISARGLRRHARLPLRLLTIGLPLTILFSTGAAWVLGVSGLAALLLATMVAPTDAALGQAVVEQETVPSRIRQALNVESGLNDGIVVPIFVVALEAFAADAPSTEGADSLLHTVVVELGIAAAVGTIVAGLVAWLVTACEERGRLAPGWANIALLVAALMCVGLADTLGGSGFIAAYVGGMVYGNLDRFHAAHQRLAEDVSQIGQAAVFLLLGAVVAPTLIDGLDASIVWFTVLALTIARIVPVVIACMRTGLEMQAKLFIGWFGPRGLATVVLIVLLVDRDIEGTEVRTIAEAATTVVVLSVYLHGLSAAPLSRRFGAWSQRRSVSRRS